jgi:tetratricopeptide (TPR) repeat protein
MVGTPIRWSLALGAAVLGLALAAAPSSAQQVGQIKGKVVDAQNKPIEGAKIVIAMVDGASRKLEIKSKKGGDFLQIGLMPGNYKVTAEKDGMSQEFSFHVSIGETKEVNFMLQPGGQAAGGPMTKEEAAKQAARVEGIKAKFAEGATLSNDGKYDEAIAKFQEVLVDVPKCTECYLNIGSVYAQKKEYDKSEESYRKVLELNPDSVDAYLGLATIFNSQKKFTEAQEMSAQATKRASAATGGAANPEALYNQGVIAWNANDFQKAQESFTAALAAKPDHAESHFMLGKVYLNLGKLPDAAKEFETYTKIAPNGPNAKEAASNFEMLKQYIK